MTALASDWRGDSEERLTPDVLRWFRERVRYELRDAALRTKPPVPERLALALEAHFTAQPEYYLLWVPDQRFELSDWDDEDRAHVPGAWAPRERFRIDVERMVAALGQPLADNTPPVDNRPWRASEYPVVPPADVDKALKELARTPRNGMCENGVEMLFVRDPASMDRARARLAKAQQLCPVCLTEYPRAHQAGWQDRRCPTCREAKLRRCNKCGEGFTAEHGQQRKCDRCRKGGPCVQ